jgi:hypothetical protein
MGLIAVAAGLPAFAQQPPKPATPDEGLQEIVVTGSRIAERRQH